jgi:hypothetical protein
VLLQSDSDVERSRSVGDWLANADARPHRSGVEGVKSRWSARRFASLGLGLAATRLVAPTWCARDVEAWYRGEPKVTRELAEEMVSFEARDDAARTEVAPGDRFAGEWALVTHQMTALGLAQVCLGRPEWKEHYVPILTGAALKSALPEMRDFGTDAWGHDVMTTLESAEGHAYYAYPALAVGMARVLNPSFPKDVAREHDAVIAAFERRLLASPTALIETYPDEAYPTDVAAVAAAIAVHGRATGADHARVLAHWESNVRRVQIDPKSGFVFQRMHVDGRVIDGPRGSGTGLAAYYAGFASAPLARTLADALFRHSGSFWGFDAIEEFADGRLFGGDVDSGPVFLGVSVAATGFVLAPARAFGRRDVFEQVYRTVDLFGVPTKLGDRRRYLTGGPIGNALLLAMMTSGPEVAR